MALLMLCVCMYLPCLLKGSEIQPALPVLSDHCGHTRLSKPKAG